MKKRASTPVSASLIAGFRGSHCGFPGVDVRNIRRTWSEGRALHQPDAHLGGFAYGMTDLTSFRFVMLLKLQAPKKLIGVCWCFKDFMAFLLRCTIVFL